MIWRDGLLPENAPAFSQSLSDDLLSYGYSLLMHGLRYEDLGGEAEASRMAYEVAAEALEAVVAKGVADQERDFHRLVAAAAYHLGRFSARAYSLLHEGLAQANLTPAEQGIAKLMLRDLDGLAQDLARWFGTGEHSEDALVAALAQSDTPDSGAGEQGDAVLAALVDALDSNFMSALALTMLALERGEQSLVVKAQERFRKGLDVAGELSLVSQWWCHRLAIRLVDGLWQASFHVVLPLVDPEGGASSEWAHLRKLFIALLYRRSKAEIELWPSQMTAAKRVLDFDASLVLSLPTSAGKTRIAELCILACLARRRRVVFVTPLRALSAQTEVGLRRTFVPLGKSVSSLYGSIGASGTDVDALRTRDIVVATPEKLDFALRSDPSLLDDVGLVVLDEGHMIGLGEREVRYEAQIQRLLRRPDASTRRLVCLSAILPDGDQLEDFAAWLTRDKPEGLIKNSWRPTRLRFGEVDWKGSHAQLNITVGDEKPFIPKFLIAEKPKTGKARKLFPSDQNELCIATAWRLVKDGQTVLVFCPMRRSVLPFAKRIIEMHKRGLVDSLLSPPASSLSTALTIGAEWFGEDHEILRCLRLGVAIHHGALPSAYRKEVERLLREGTLRVTVSSPTLAQGLNLAATCLVFQGLNRGRDLIEEAEFRNVVGRAGRAYVDVEGLVLYPIFDEHHKRRAAWDKLVAGDRGREMESGLLRLVYTLLSRMAKKLQSNDVRKLVEYLAGQGAWEFPELPGEPAEAAAEERERWNSHLMSLDTAILSLLTDAEVPDDQVAAKLDEVLESSLFRRRLARRSDAMQKVLTAGLEARTRLIWASSSTVQRRGYFLAGVGLSTGKRLDELALVLESLLLTANVSIEAGLQVDALQAIQAFAEVVFGLPPFAPKKLVDNWREVLRMWLLGEPLSELLSDGDETIEFIEQAFVYNLPWAMEAVRVRSEAHENPFSTEAQLSDYPRAHAVAALETGTMSVSAATLIQAGFASRLGAILAVTETQATFDSMEGLISWVGSDDIKARSEWPSWPTPETHALWIQFCTPSNIGNLRSWSITTYTSPVKWKSKPPAPGAALRLGSGPARGRIVLTEDYEEVGTIEWQPNEHAVGVAVVTSTGAADTFEFDYLGPEDFVPS